MDDMSSIEKDFVQLARLVLEGRNDDVAAMSRRILRQIAHDRPDLSSEARNLFSRFSNSITRQAVATPLPVDADSRLELLKRELHPVIQIEPTWPSEIKKQLDAVVQERLRETELVSAGVSPTRSLLFVGPPGVGKTLAAKWLASKMDRPILILDLAAVMSSYLGRTGNNIRIVLDYARSFPSVLLLDEFDAIAKRRDDASDVGELKRLVTVLLQTIDDWPQHGILLAATNHPELLDLAVWRRFDQVLEFPMPSVDEMNCSMQNLLRAEDSKDVQEMTKTLSVMMQGSSFADAARVMSVARRQAVLNRIPLEQALGDLAMDFAKQSPLDRKLNLALALENQGVSQRRISTMTGVARDTIRKHGKRNGNGVR